MKRWDEINEFVQNTGLHFAFGLNGLYGRKSRETRMNTTNIHEFLKYTASKNHKVYAFELGNELGNGGEKGWKVLVPFPYSADYATVHQYIENIWGTSPFKPLFVGPDSNPDSNFTSNFIKYTHQSLSATTYQFEIK